jgi:peptidoglycan hydrolase CwlO-like protein
MGLGSTAKKLQRVADLAEDLVGRLNELRERVNRMEETVDTTNERVATMQDELATQRALIEALAAADDVDVEAVVETVENEEGAAEAEAEAPQTEEAGSGGVDGNA